MSLVHLTCLPVERLPTRTLQDFLATSIHLARESSYRLTNSERSEAIGFETGDPKTPIVEWILFPEAPLFSGPNCTIIVRWTGLFRPFGTFLPLWNQ